MQRSETMLVTLSVAGFSLSFLAETTTARISDEFPNGQFVAA